MANPYLTPPQVESPQSRSWGLGYAYGFLGPDQSTMAPADIQPEDIDAFNEGVLVGQDAAINGAPLDNACVDLHAEGPTAGHLALEAPEGVMWIGDCIEGVAGGVGGGILFFLNLSIALETFTDDPSQRLTDAASQLQTKLQGMGFTTSLALYVGGGVDTSVAGCELQLTSIFRDQSAATAAAKALNRPQWLVVSWRTDQSAGATIVDYST